MRPDVEVEVRAHIAFFVKRVLIYVRIFLKIKVLNEGIHFNDLKNIMFKFEHSKSCLTYTQKTNLAR